MIIVNTKQVQASPIRDGKGHTSITLNREKSDGFDVLNDAEDDNDGYEYDSVAIKGQQQVNPPVSD